LKKNLINNNFKIGVLYSREGQIKEEEMFSNEHGSYLFEEFLDLLGDRIKLNGFSGFRGGLDVTNDTTGSESVYTVWRDNSIMFHVSTLLPFYLNTPQQVERKRHIGNDIVVIVFKEGNNPLNPLTIVSSFIHIIIVVQPILEKSKTFYRISVGSKALVPTFSPPLPEDPSIISKEDLRDYILCKAINGERSSYKIPPLKDLDIKNRTNLLEEIGNTFSDGDFDI